MPTMRRAVLTTTSQTRRARLTTASVIAASRHCAGDPDLDRGAPGIGKRLAALEYTVDSHDHDDAGEHAGKGRVHVIIEHDPAHLLQRLGRRQHLPTCGRVGKFRCVADEAYL